MKVYFHKIARWHSLSESFRKMILKQNRYQDSQRRVEYLAFFRRGTHGCNSYDHIQTGALICLREDFHGTLSKAGQVFIPEYQEYFSLQHIYLLLFLN